MALLESGSLYKSEVSPCDTKLTIGFFMTLLFLKIFAKEGSNEDKVRKQKSTKYCIFLQSVNKLPFLISGL